jgi:anti-sigma B factor antagonist
MRDQSVPAHHDSPTPKAECELAVTSVDGVVVIAVSGTVDALTAPQLGAALEAAFAQKPPAVIADLSDVEFLASAGMSVLVGANDNARASLRYAVVADGAATSRPMKLVGLDEVFEIYATLGEALAELGYA